MQKQLKILFIPRWYPNRVDLLKGIFVKRYVQAVALTHHVGVLFVNADPVLRDKTYDTEFTVEEGINTVRVYYNNSLPSIPFLSVVIKFYRYLHACRIGIKIINEKFGIPDISHIQVLTRTFFPAYFYKFFNKVPYIITEHWSGYLPEDGSYKGALKKILTKIAVRRASAVTTVSKSLRDAMLAHGLKNKYSVIPNVVDITKFYPAPDKKQKTKIILLSVSDMDNRAKNISGTIRVIKKLSEQRSDFEYHLIGDGADKEELERLVVENGLQNKFVFFQGAKNTSEVAEEMRNADMLLLFSNYDNMPCVMIESLASGVPVIGSSVNGIKENITKGMGLLVPPGEEEIFLQAIISCMDQLGSFDKNALHQYAKDKFSYEVVGKMFDEIYKNALKS